MGRSLEPAASTIVEYCRRDAVSASFFASWQITPSAIVDQDRQRYGRSKVEIRDYRGPGCATLRASRDHVLFLCNGDSAAQVTGTRGAVSVEPHSWTYLGHGPVELISSGGGYCVIAIQKAALQSIASAKTGAARKLADGLLTLPALPTDVLSRETDVPGARGIPRDVTDWAPQLVEMLACAMLATESLDYIFPIAGGINRAICYINEHLSETCTPERLARVVGVTPRTVREGFRSYLGISIANFVRQTRLSWARKRLESGHESRSVRELALFLGFQDSPEFSRAYHRAFGESPTETRARSTRSMC